MHDIAKKKTGDDAERTTGLEARRMFKVQQELRYLACQLGRSKTETRIAIDGTAVSGTVFELIAFGQTWEEAMSMAARKADAK